MAQALSNFLVEHRLATGKKCCMETVFSPLGKVDLMRLAAMHGYKVYLYFVATENPEINKARVKARVLKKGHGVPEKAIEDRYYRSLGLLHDAAQAADRVYFFDNSDEEGEQRIIAEYFIENGEKALKIYDEDRLPFWFIEYYLNN